MDGQTPRSVAHARIQREKRIAAAKAELKHIWDYEREHFLYRCYDADDQLLYIGCTHDVETRMSVHASSWQNPASAYLNLHMKRYEVEGPFIGRIAGRKAEREAIEHEAPFLNLHHNKGRGAKRVPAPSVNSEEFKAAMEAASQKINEWFGDAFGGRSA